MGFGIAGNDDELARIAAAQFTEADVQFLLKKAIHLQWMLLPDQRKSIEELQRLLFTSLEQHCSAFIEERRKESRDQ